MMTHILTLDENPIRFFGLFLLGMSSFFLAAQFDVGFVSLGSRSFIINNLLTKSAIAILGIVMIPLQVSFPSPLWSIGLQVCIGILCGLGVFYCEKYILKCLWRFFRYEKSTKAIEIDGRVFKSNRSLGLIKNLWVKETCLPNRWIVDLNLSMKDFKKNIIFYTAIAVAEEIIFRGFLIKMISQLDGFLFITGIIVIMAFFAVSHGIYGGSHIIAKMPLTVVSTVLVVCMGFLLASVIVHVIENYMILKGASKCVNTQTQKRAYFAFNGYW